MGLFNSQMVTPVIVRLVWRGLALLIFPPKGLEFKTKKTILTFELDIFYLPFGCADNYN